MAGRLFVTVFMLVHALLAAYAIGIFIWIRAGAPDLAAGFARRDDEPPTIV